MRPEKQLLEKFHHTLSQILEEECFLSLPEKNRDTLREIVSPSILNGGKRIRPLVYLLSHLGLGGEESPEMFRIAASLELLHSFALVHDDIIDDSKLRRNRASLHEQFKSSFREFPEKINGKHFALIGGDILFTFSLNILNRLEMNNGTKNDILSLILRTAEKTALGQYLEMESSLDPFSADEKTILRIYEMKTSGYTFSCPLSLGAVTSDKKELIPELENIGSQLGAAYQIQDDLEDIFQDFSANIVSLPFYHLRRNASEPEKRLIRQFMEKGVETEISRRVLSTLLQEKGVEKICREKICFHLNEAEKSLKALSMENIYADAMNRILEFLFGKRDRKGD